jgi:hypothetical protein
VHPEESRPCVLVLAEDPCCNLGKGKSWSPGMAELDAPRSRLRTPDQTPWLLPEKTPNNETNSDKTCAYHEEIIELRCGVLSVRVITHSRSMHLSEPAIGQLLRKFVLDSVSSPEQCAALRLSVV